MWFWLSGRFKNDIIAFSHPQVFTVAVGYTLPHNVQHESLSDPKCPEMEDSPAKRTEAQFLGFLSITIG